MSTDEIYKYFKPPFKVASCDIILDSENNHALDIRGYGYLSNAEPANVDQIQQSFAEHIVKMLNRDWEMREYFKRHPEALED